MCSDKTTELFLSQSTRSLVATVESQCRGTSELWCGQWEDFLAHPAQQAQWQASSRGGNRVEAVHLQALRNHTWSACEVRQREDPLSRLATHGPCSTEMEGILSKNQQAWASTGRWTASKGSCFMGSAVVTSDRGPVALREWEAEAQVPNKAQHAPSDFLIAMTSGFCGFFWRFICRWCTWDSRLILFRIT